jgi:hypothetical protein
MKQALRGGVSAEVDSKHLLVDSLNFDWEASGDTISRHTATLNCKSDAVVKENLGP